MLVSVTAGLAALALSAGDAPHRIPLGQTVTGHYTVEVMLNGAGAFPFVIDTAASHSAVLQGVAEGFGFQSAPDDLHAVQTLTETVRMERFAFDRFGFAKVETGTINAVVIPAPPGPELPIVGLLGSDALDGRRYEIDFNQAEMLINAAPPRHADGQIDAIRQVLIGSARMARSGGRVHVLVDTGSARTIVNSHLANRIERQRSTLHLRVGGATRLAREVNADGLVRIDQFRIGGYCRRAFSAVEADVDVFRALGWADQPAMILGLDVLRDAVLSIDHAGDVFEISPRDGADRCRGRRVQTPGPS
jgi:predicted aspartyl protease